MHDVWLSMLEVAWAYIRHTIFFVSGYDVSDGSLYIVNVFFLWVINIVDSIDSQSVFFYYVINNHVLKEKVIEAKHEAFYSRLKNIARDIAVLIY